MINQSKKKLLNFLDDYVDSGNFQKKVMKIRKKLGIPLEGLLLKRPATEDYLIKIMYDSIFTPDELLKMNSKMQAISIINSSTEKLSSDFPIHNFLISSYFKLYLLYNIKFNKGLKTLSVGTSRNLYDASLCGVGTFINIKKNSGNFKLLLKDYPIYIKISPYASQRDLIDYIKKNWWQLDRIFKLYKDNSSRLGKARTRSEKIKARNNLIYKNRNLKIKEIVRIVNDSTDDFNEVVDEGLVGKIISLEKKKRT